MEKIRLEKNRKEHTAFPPAVTCVISVNFTFSSNLPNSVKLEVVVT
jgi:hypothetical protein